MPLESIRVGYFILESISFTCSGFFQVLQVSRRLDPGHHQHRRQLHLPRVSLRHPHQRRPGDRRRFDEGVHVAVRRPRHVRPRLESRQDLDAEETLGGDRLHFAGISISRLIL